MQETRHPKIGIWKNIPMDRDRLRGGIAEIVELAKKGEHKAIVEKIRELIPEYAGGNNNSDL